MRFRRPMLYGLALAFAVGGAASAHGTGRPLKAELSGAVEVPGPGDPDGTGSAVITVNPGKSEVCWDLKVANIGPATMAHVHKAPPGAAGPVTLAVTPPAGGSSSGCKAVGEGVATDLFENAGDFYVNIHNAEYPAGAVRGQLSGKKLN